MSSAAAVKTNQGIQNRERTCSVCVCVGAIDVTACVCVCVCVPPKLNHVVTSSPPPLGLQASH